MSASDYLLEKRLWELNPDLHKRFTDTVTVLSNMLGRFQLLFPEYTDHSEFHCMNVINFCNILIGEEQIERMNEDEIYVLLMSCYLHDVGMGLTDKDYIEFGKKLDGKDYFQRFPGRDATDFVRDYHHEFSGLYIRKYAEMLEIPTEEHTFAVAQVARGHRRTDLFDPEEYPDALQVEGGNTIDIVYLSALIRLADEIDVVTDRNPKLLYDLDSLTDEYQIGENRRLEAVRNMDVLSDCFVLNVFAEDEELWRDVEKMVGKMQETLDYCRDVTEKRTPHRISQERVLLHRIYERRES